MTERTRVPANDSGRDGGASLADCKQCGGSGKVAVIGGPGLLRRVRECSCRKRHKGVPIRAFKRDADT